MLVPCVHILKQTWGQGNVLRAEQHNKSDTDSDEEGDEMYDDI